MWRIEYKKYYIVGLLFVCIGVSTIPTHVVRAETILFNQTVSGHLYAAYGAGIRPFIRVLTNPHFAIAYHMRVLNVDTGALVSCGSTVPVDTRLRFEFLPHTYSDVYWFGTGTASDSPYGAWSRDAARSGEGMCVDKNYYFTEQPWVGPTQVVDRPNRTMHYAEFAVNQPRRQILGLPNTCTTVGGGLAQECVLSNPTNITAQFSIDQTYGKFYWAFARRIIDRGRCVVVDAPLYTGVGAQRMSDRDDMIIVRNLSEQFQLTIPQQSLNCPISVMEPEGQAPQNVRISGGERCQAGVPVMFTVSATDLDAEESRSRIRFLFDWDNDGNADQIVPATGYIPSDSTQTVRHTWITPGAKTFKVMAQDMEGLTSSWVSHTTDECAPSDQPLNTDFNVTTYGALPDGVLNLNLDRTVTNTTCKARWDAQYVGQCTLTKNGGEPEDVAASGELDLEPGLYVLQCDELNSGAILSNEVRCVKNIDFREI
jgi:hypothetical protein